MSQRCDHLWQGRGRGKQIIKFIWRNLWMAAYTNSQKISFNRCKRKPYWCAVLKHKLITNLFNPMILFTLFKFLCNILNLIRFYKMNKNNVYVDCWKYSTWWFVTSTLWNDCLNNRRQWLPEIDKWVAVKRVGEWKRIRELTID